MNSVLVRNNVKVIGQGEKTIIFAHGFGCDQTMWRFIVPYFEQDYRVILFDYVGSGNSDLEAYTQERYSSLHGYKHDLLDICETLDIHDAIFVGHSVSSMIGMLASIQRPHCFERLIMLGPSSRYLNDQPDYIGGFEEKDLLELLNFMEMNFIGWASYLAPIVMKNLNRPELSKELESSFWKSNPAITHEFAKVTFFSDHRKDIVKSSIPTLILQCSEDNIVPIEAAQYLHRHLRNSTFRLMEAKGHYPHLSYPNETIRHIKDYLASETTSIEKPLSYKN